MIKEYTIGNIRNISIIGHGDVGKTTVVENMLYLSGAIDKMGCVENGDTVSDFEAEEIAHKISTHNSLVFTEFLNTKINIIDTPGIPDFVGEVRASLRVCEGAIVVVDAIEGIQMGTKKIWEYANEYKVPRIIFVNKMDKDKLSFEKLVAKLTKQLDAPIVPIEIPIGSGEDFKGIIDLVLMKAVYPNKDKSGVALKDIPFEYEEQANSYRESLAETIADIDDKLVDKVLTGKKLDDSEIAKGVLELTQTFKIIPLVCGSARESIGMLTLLKMIVKFLPSPLFVGETIGFDPFNKNELAVRHPSTKEPFAAFVYKTRLDPYSGKFSYIRIRSGELKKDMEVLNANNNSKEKILHIYSIMGKKQIEIPKVIAGDIASITKLEHLSTGDTICSLNNSIKLPPLKLPKPIHYIAITTDDKANMEKMISSFNKVALEDPTFKIEHKETGESVILGMGELQLKILLEKVEKKLNIKIQTSFPKVAYKETILGKSQAHYKHKKQTGGHGQYGEVYIKIEPLDKERHFEFVSKIVGGAIPRNFIPGVEKGVLEAMNEGTLASYPVTRIKVTLYDGSFHAVDSSELAFKLAGFHAMKLALSNTKPTLLEPVYNITVHVMEDFVGAVIGDIQGRRGRIVSINSDSRTGNQLIMATVPFKELINYSTELRSLTKDQATFEVTPSHYEPLTDKLADRLINA